MKPLFPPGIEANLNVEFPALNEQKPHPISFWLITSFFVFMLFLSVFGSII